MLIQTVHMPRVYTDVPTDPVAAALYSSAIVRLLEDTLRSCVVLVDDGNVIKRDIFRARHKLPPKFQPRVKELLTRLQTRNRLIRVGGCSQVEQTCGRPECQCALGIATYERPEAVISSGSCSACGSLIRSGLEIVDLNSYGASGFAKACEKDCRIELSDGEWDRAEFERQVWQPLFRTTKHVKLFDRMIGRHLTERLLKRRELRQIRQPLPLAIGAHFDAGLRWVFEQFVVASIGRAGRVFEVTCAVDSTKLSNAELGEAATALRRFAADVSRGKDIEMTMHVKVDSASAEMPHGRFLLTDQVSLLVERGFDLLRTDGRIRDVIITHISDEKAWKIEKEASDLAEVSCT